MDLSGFEREELERVINFQHEQSVDIKSSHEVIVECASESEQQSVFEQLTNEGKQCRLSTF